MQRVESRTNSGSQGELAAARARTVKTVAGSTRGAVSWPNSGLTPVKAGRIYATLRAGDSSCVWPPGSRALRFTRYWREGGCP